MGLLEFFYTPKGNDYRLVIILSLFKYFATGTERLCTEHT